MTTRRLRLLAAAPLLTGALMAGGDIAAPAASPIAPAPCSAATYQHRVALVVEHANGGSLRVCIGFDGTSITGEQVLQASGIEFATAGYGSLGDAVCQIDHEPATYPSTCWTTTSPYWVLFKSSGGGAWSASTQGVSTAAFSDGDAEGFRYDPQGGSAAAPVSPAGTCEQSGAVSAPAPAAATPPPAAVAVPTQTPINAYTGASPTVAAQASAGVIGAAPRTTAAHTSGGLDLGLVIAAAAGGVLAGLLVVQLLRRRRTA